GRSLPVPRLSLQSSSGSYLCQARTRSSPFRRADPRCAALFPHLGMRADAPENAEYCLYEERRMYQAAVQKMCQIVEVPHVVAFEFETGFLLAALRHNVLDVLKSVAEDEVAAPLQRFALPGEAKLGIAIQHGKEAEVERSHVERGEFRLGGPHTFRDLHKGRASGSDVDYRAGLAFQQCQNGREAFNALIGLSCDGVTRMHM